MASRSLEKGGRRRAVAMGLMIAASCCVVGSLAARQRDESRRTVVFAGQLDAEFPGTGA